MADIGDAVQEALSGSTAAPLEQIAARKEAEKKMQEAGGVWNPNIHHTLGGGQVIYPEKTGIFGNLLPTIMNQGDYVSDPNALNKKTWLKANPNLKGQHKLRTQYDRLLAKYGPNFANTTQGKLLANYLSGVAVERGGGLGARDETYGGGKFAELDEFGNPIDPDKFKEAENFRQQLLDRMGLAGSDFGDGTMGTVAEQLGALSDADYNKLRYGLSSDQFYNFNQQLMAADPSEGNVDYKEARPWSSGSGIKSLTRFLPGMGAAQTFLGGLFPEQSEWGDWEANQQIFKDTSIPELGQGDGGGVMNAWQNPYDKWGDAEAKIPEDDMGVDLSDVVLGYDPGDMAYTGVAPREGYQYAYDQEGNRYEIPIGGDQSGETYGGRPFSWRAPDLTSSTGIPSLTPTPFDYASLAPQYPGYVNQGLASPQFGNWYDNLNKYYGYS
jgi:hypothetical protein